MRTLIVLVVGLLAVGCGKPEQPVNTYENKKRVGFLSHRTEAKPVKEPTLEDQKALAEKVIGEYEHKDEDGDTHKHVYLENGDYEQYFNGEPHLNETQLFRFKWSISNGEIHSISHTGVINIFKINKDKSITQIAVIVDGKRKDIPKVSKRTWKKIK
jgi:hypothetical protein